MAPRMLDEGIYRLSYKSTDGDKAGAGDGLAVLRGGRVLGSDPWGGLIAGSYEYDAEKHTNRVRVRFDVPAGGILVTGFSAGPRGAVFDIVCTFDAAARTAVVDVGGRPVALELTFLGPLPG